MSSGDARERLIQAVARELRVGPVARRRILAELADHIDDAADDLRRAGVPRERAAAEAVKRLGDARTIVDGFAATRPARSSRLGGRRSLAWIAVAAMSVVTAVAAELPQASGAKAPAKVSAPVTRRLAPEHPSTRHTDRRAAIVASAAHDRLVDRR